MSAKSRTRTVVPELGLLLASLMPVSAFANSPVIGAIRIVTDPIFDNSDQRESGLVYRAANRLHVETRESVIQAQLLFREGDLYAPQLLAETERNLRKLPFLREPTVTAIDAGNGVVDIEVRTHDVWTASPGVSFGRAGGANRSTIEFEDQNLFGYGKHVSVGYARDAADSSLRFRWRDPNVFGSRWIDDLQYEQRDRGQRWSVNLERPFYSLATPWGAGIAATQDERIVHRYRLGEKADDYLTRHDSIDLHGGRAWGAGGAWARRWLAGLRVDRSEFLATDATGSASLPMARKLAYPYVRFEWLEDDFAVGRNLDQIGRSEDLQFGRQFGIELGLAGRGAGSDRSAALLNLQASRGLRLAGEQQLFLSASGGVRLEDQGARDMLLSLGARYYRRTSPKTMLFVRLSADAGRALDGDHALSLGGDNGLRGYPLQYQQGTARALLTVEGRLFTDWYPFRLAHVGAAAFVDVGRTWGRDAFGAGSAGTLSDVGLGLRFGNSRSALGSVLHLDVAMPLNRSNSIQGLQFLIQTKRSF
jgi:outer membrane translocation and assembly module TamA